MQVGRALFGAYRGGRLSNTWVTYRSVGDIGSKGLAIPHGLSGAAWAAKLVRALDEGPAAD
jgi:hypothetical protein